MSADLSETANVPFSCGFMDLHPLFTLLPPCKASRYDEIERKYGNLIARDRTFLVVQMIESWYVAGLENQHSLPMLDDAPSQTDDLLKRDLENMMEEGTDRLDVLQEIFKHFDMDRAPYKNNSFEYFCSAVLD